MDRRGHLHRHIIWQEILQCFQAEECCMGCWCSCVNMMPHDHL